MSQTKKTVFKGESEAFKISGRWRIAYLAGHELLNEGHGEDRGWRG